VRLRCGTFEQQGERFFGRVLGAETTYRKDLITKVEIGTEEIDMSEGDTGTLKCKANGVTNKGVDS